MSFFYDLESVNIWINFMAESFPVEFADIEKIRGHPGRFPFGVLVH